MEQTKYLKNIREKLYQNFLKHKGKGSRYAVPNLWIPDKQNLTKPQPIKMNPPTFYLNTLDYILSQKYIPTVKNHGGKWSIDSVIYNIFVRTTCAFDHNQNGKLDLPINQDGWRETGTLLKATMMIPYIKSLGANTIHLLPITSIGSDGNKGNLGSPYAIKNPYKLDELLHEPNAGLNVEEEFKLFVNAAHHFGIRVVVEFVFRTSSKDSDWIRDHPEWYYWIKDKVKDRKPHHHDETKFGNPIFTEEELKKIISAVESGKYSESIPPHQIYRDMFTNPPRQEKIAMEEGRLIGKLNDGTRVRVPGAFADWPPHDTQPPWGDVTYLKMYDHPDFNYIAYNTIRMYDTKLASAENINKELWEKIAAVIPYYQHTFGIDGVMIDMGHALPMDLKHDMIRRAREIDPDFAFWDENFSVEEQSVKEGYNAVIGYQWSDQHHRDKFKNMLRRFSSEGFALPFFATPESHNTPRAASREGEVAYSRYAWAISNFIPAIPFIHSGFELGETVPINTGLDFKKEELKKYPSEQLPLFSEYCYNWANENQMVDWIQKISLVRKKYHAMIADHSPRSFIWMETKSKYLIAFIRKSIEIKHQLLIIANSNMKDKIDIDLSVDTTKKALDDLLSGKTFTIEKSVLIGKMNPGQVSVLLI
ncbi:MAG: alpha-amylase [Ignavibacteriales bacterium]|nr:alpha-amylase [Ignavibacteriales bacterium]